MRGCRGAAAEEGWAASIAVAPGVEPGLVMRQGEGRLCWEEMDN